MLKEEKKMRKNMITQMLKASQGLMKHSVLVLAVLGLMQVTAQAATVTKSATGTDLTAGASWGGTAPTSDDVATWVSTSLGAGLTLGSSTSWGSIGIASALSDVSITGAGPLTLGAGGIDMTSSAVNLTVGTPITLGANQNWTVNSGRTLAASGIISGTSMSLTKAGLGTLTLSATNSYTGKTIIQGGELQIMNTAYLSNAGVPGGLGAPTGADAVIDIYNGGILRVGIGDPRVTPTSTDRTINLASAGAGTVEIRVNGNDTTYGFGAVTATGTGAKILTLSPQTHGDRSVMTFNGAISDVADGSPLSLAVADKHVGADIYTLNLNGANTFTGPISLTTITSAGPFTMVIGGSGSLAGGNYTNTISMAARTVFKYASSTGQTLAGAISGPGALQVTGSGPVTLSGTNTYSGNTTVNNSCSLILDTIGSLGFKVTDTTVNKLTGAGSATLNGAFTIDTTGTTVYVGSWTLVDITTKTFGGSFGVTGFTGPVGTVFTKVDGIKTWTFDTSTGVLSVTAKALITPFGALGNAGVIDQGAKTIVLDVPYGTDLATLAPTFVTSSGTCDQTSGSAPSPTFASANPATYTVTDVSASVTNSYTVTVAVAPVPPGGVGSGLNAWYDASLGVTTNGSNVTAWKDQSGNGYHATLGAGTPLYGASQINGRPAVFFRGGNNYLNINYNIVPRQEYIVFKSGRYAYDPGNPNLWGNDWGGPFGQQNVNNHWMFESGTKRMWGSNIPLAVSQNGTNIVQNNANGNPYGMANVTNYMILKVNPVNYPSAYGLIGRPNTAWGNGYMDVAEIIVYNRVLTNEEENAVGYYLATKYGVSSTYVNPNPTAPENLNAIAGDAQVSLTWTPYPSATSYNVKRSTTPGGPYTTVGTPAGTSFTDSPLVNGTPYYYVVSAVASSESPNSTEASATPTGVNATLSTVVTSEPTVWADGISSATITVTLLNSSNTPIANKLVSLAQTTGSGATITTVTGTTGADGKAIFTVASTTIGTAVFTATDVTDSLPLTEDTATVIFADPSSRLAINVNITGGTEETASTLSGPAGGLGTTWNQFVGPNSPGVLRDALGPATTVTLTSNFGLPNSFDSPVIALPMLRGSMCDFGKGRDDINVTINGLKARGFYDIWLVTLRNQPYGSDGTEQYVGWWSTTNATTSSSNQLVNAVNPTINTTTFVAGYNYVRFQNVKANDSGQIVFTGVAGDQLDGSDNNHRHGLNGLQIKELPPKGTVLFFF
jgi:autotransporter-associated beta strand protein